MKGKLFVVGIGPGSIVDLTLRATQALQSAEIIVGYKIYVDLITPLLTTQQIYSSGMKQEMDRVAEAIELVCSGKRVAMVSSGDAGVYGMAGPIYEYLSSKKIDLEVEVIPGVTAAISAAAILGAPLMHDFVLISLSDLLTPWEKIVKRIHAAGAGDFVVALYNPRSRKRREQLVEAQQILLQYRSPETPVGIVWNIAREGEQKMVTSLSQIPMEEIDMFATLIIGNSESYISGDLIITPRGYHQ